MGGFVADTYVIFNRAVFDNTYTSPSIGRALRLEEPPYIKWIRSPIADGVVMCGVFDGSRGAAAGDRGAQCM